MTTEQSQPKSARPAAEVRLGSIKASIWKNDAETGPRYSVTFERLYKDGDAWKSSSSFSADELLLLAKVADLAHTRIHDLKGQPS